jgi:hypothetical protein
MADFPWWQQHLREEQLAVQFGYLLSAANCSTLACLRDLPEESLKKASQATYGMGYLDGAYGYGSFYYGPYLDGELLLDLPSKEFKAGHFVKLPMMVSREGLEGVTFSNQSMKTIEEETADMKKHFPSASECFIAKLYELYPRESFNSRFWLRQTWFRSVNNICFPIHANIPPVTSPSTAQRTTLPPPSPHQTLCTELEQLHHCAMAGVPDGGGHEPQRYRLWSFERQVLR